MNGAQNNPWMRWGKRALTLFFLLAVPALLYMLARNLDWGEVRQALVGFVNGVQAGTIGLSLHELDRGHDPPPVYGRLCRMHGRRGNGRDSRRHVSS